MSEEGKKISFSFSKSIGKSKVQNVPPPEKKKVDYIESIDEKAIKIVGGEEIEDNVLVIPMPTGNIWHDRIKNKVNADIFEPKPVTQETLTDPDAVVKPEVKIKQENIDELNGSTSNNDCIQEMEIDVLIKKEPDENLPASLEEQAAREILEDLKSNDSKSNEKKIYTIPNKEDDLRGKEESTLEDYERVSIEGFGLGLLRGMGWKPDKGIGKNTKVIENKIPELRPRGLGLGANKPNIQKVKINSSSKVEELQLKKGSCVKIIAGNNSGSYGKMEGSDDEGRIFVKLELGGNLISVNEIFLQPVTLDEYSQNSRVLNSKKLQEYKNKELKKSKKQSTNYSDDEDQVSKSKKKDKKSKKNRHYSSDDDSNPDDQLRRKRNSDSSTERREKKKSKKKYESFNNDSDSSCERKDKKKSQRERSPIDRFNNSKTLTRKRNDSDSGSERKDKKKSKRKCQSSEDDSSEKTSKREMSYNSDEDRKYKKSKKSKKHKNRDSSSERTYNHKNKNDREYSKHKKSDYSVSSKKSHRKRSASHSPKRRRRDRSRSYSPRR